MIPVPHGFQVDLVERVYAQVKAGFRIIVIQAPTGSGKTTISAYMTKRSVAKGKTSLHLVHKRWLVGQIVGRLEEFEISAGIIMRGEKPFGSAAVQVASRDTILSRCYRNQWAGLPPADIVFVDEGHHAADPSSEYRRILENYPTAIIIILSATPVGPDGKGMGPWAQKIECAAPTSQLIRENFLVPLKCYAPNRKHGRAGKMKRGVAGDLVESWKQYSENLPTVLFCSRVEHSRDAVEAFRLAGIKFAHVDADTSESERERIFAEIGNGTLQGISNVGIIGEGVDIPCLGCVQFYMNSQGRVKFIQGCGRVMRPFPGKTHGVMIDHAGNVFDHGFPDEDMEWPLNGSADAAYKDKHDAGLTPKVNYCKRCELLFKELACPQCGKLPSKPPKSIFSAPPVENTSEVLTEVERTNREVQKLDEKIKHWLKCLAVAANRGAGGSFGQAAQIYKQRYGEFPLDGFPCIPERWQWKEKVEDHYPKFKRGKAS